MYYNNQHKLDLKFGDEAEDYMKPNIELLLNLQLIKTKGNCRYDYYDEEKNNIIELKSRRNKKNQYATTLIPSSKWFCLKKLAEKNKNVYYVFNFTDKFCYFKYKIGEDFTETFITRRDRGKIEKFKHIEIPIDILIDF